MNKIKRTSKTSKPSKTCSKCIHYNACQSFTLGNLREADAGSCVNYEALHDSNVYYIGYLDGKRGRMADANKVKVGEQDMQHEALNQIELHKHVCTELNTLYAWKNSDYVDSFHQTFSEEGLAMPRVRLSDKLNRFKQLTRADAQQHVADESIRDTLLDLANYAIMTIMELDALDRKEPHNDHP